MNMTLDDSITITAAKLTGAEDQVNLNSTTTKLQNVTAEYVDRVFGYADQFVIHVNEQVCIQRVLEIVQVSSKGFQVFFNSCFSHPWLQNTAFINHHQLI